MGVVEKNKIIALEHEVTCLRIKNAKLVNFYRNLSEKVAFNKNLPINTEYDKGFNKAFEMVKNMLNGNVILE